MKLSEFIEEYQLKSDSSRITMRVSGEDKWPKDSRHFQVILEFYGMGIRDPMAVEFTQGSAHTKNPTTLDVLSCLQIDCQFSECNFEDWCAELGFNSDSIKDLALYNFSKEESRRLKKFMGNDIYKVFIECENDL